MTRLVKNEIFLSASVAALFGLVLLSPTNPRIAAPGAKVVTLPANCSSGEIQGALDRLVDGGEVVLPPGTYQIQRPIVLGHDRQTLRGSGDATVLVLADGANCPVIMLGSPDRRADRPTTQLRLADLAINGNRRNQAAEFWRTAADGSLINNNGVSVWNVTDAVVEHVTAISCRSGGLVAAKAKRLEVRNFIASDNQYDGLACYYTEESRFTELSLHDNLAAGISLDLSFNHNVIEQASLAANDLGVFMRDSRDNVFRDLTINGSRHHGVFIAQAGESTEQGWKLMPGTECTGNRFEGLTVSGCGGRPFIVNDPSCKGNLVSGERYAENERGTLARAGESYASVRSAAAAP